MDTFLKEPEHSKQLSDTMESHAFGSENSDTEDKDYSLSCGSSSFGNDEDLFQGEELENNDEMEETAAVIAEVGIIPYQFEPYISDSYGPISENESGDEENRLADNAW
jgi:hypothetical protein